MIALLIQEKSMQNHREAAIEYASKRQDEFLNSLKEIIRIPSISTDPTHKADMEKAARWIAERLTQVGMQKVEVYPSPGHPIIFAEHLCNETDAPTVLIYGHYDVQPPDPLNLWETPPFEPEQRGDNLYARGASDMKGQILASINAVESVLKTGSPKLNIKFVIEGEEEIGSPNLPPFLEQHAEMLSCDIALNPDSGMISADFPTITYALRGLAYFELHVYGPKQDLHSGLFGGVVHNPAQALSELIAGMHDGNGCVTLPGFYDKVRPLTDEERLALTRLPMDEKYYMHQTGVPALYGEKGFTPVEQVGARPTLEINGLYSGFTGEGQKTIIPSWAMAKISMRLVPDQDPIDVHQQLQAYLQEHAPKSIQWKLTILNCGPSSISDIHHPATQALADALEKVWGTLPLFKRDGGSIPIVAYMQRILNTESVLTGFGLSDDNIHSPNEKLHLPTWYKGINSLIHFFYNYEKTL
jgi:acetylornithine deacetylase/succinyl-diaminopimelate desuccinylase-like protein